ncbi:unnamed protein product [Closterium sp. NIES-64]|nr:unnamed protein product [Closterium sp. NIES-64]
MATTARTLLQQYSVAVGGSLGAYSSVMRRAGYKSDETQVHRAVALPAKDIRTGEPSAKYARAAPTHHGSPAFSFVEYGAREGEALYGQLSLLMRARRSTDQHGAPLHAVAYIKPWKAVGVDQLTGCVKLEELGNPDACVVIPIANLRRVVHVVQSFDREGVWLLNKWAEWPA